MQIRTRTELEQLGNALLEPLFPVARGIRLLGVSLSSLAEEQAEREPEFSLPRYALLCNGDHASAWIEIADTKRLITASCATVEGGA